MRDFLFFGAAGRWEEEVREEKEKTQYYETKKSEQNTGTLVL